MTKEDLVKILKENNITFKIEHSVIIIYLEKYTFEEIQKELEKYSDYNGSIGFRPLERLTDEKE